MSKAWCPRALGREGGYLLGSVPLWAGVKLPPGLVLTGLCALPKVAWGRQEGGASLGESLGPSYLVPIHLKSPGCVQPGVLLLVQARTSGPLVGAEQMRWVGESKTMRRWPGSAEGYALPLHSGKPGALPGGGEGWVPSWWVCAMSAPPWPPDSSWNDQSFPGAVVGAGLRWAWVPSPALSPLTCLSLGTKQPPCPVLLLCHGRRMVPCPGTDSLIGVRLLQSHRPLAQGIHAHPIQCSPNSPHPSAQPVPPCACTYPGPPAPQILPAVITATPFWGQFPVPDSYQPNPGGFCFPPN